MAAVTVKIPVEAHRKLAALANERRRPMGDILAELIEEARRQQRLDALNAAFASLRADPEAWAEYQAEVRSMEGTLMDGLEDDPWIE